MESLQLDIGGCTFKTSKSTLCSVDGYFYRMLNNDCWAESHSEYPLFIDRDPETFPTILSYLRTKKLLLNKETDSVYLLKLRVEAEYYQLDDLISKIDELLHLKNQLQEVITVTQYKSISINESSYYFSQGWKYVDSYQGNETAGCTITGSIVASSWKGNQCTACHEYMLYEKFLKHSALFRPTMMVVCRDEKRFKPSDKDLNDSEESNPIAFDESFG